MRKLPHARKEGHTVALQHVPVGNSPLKLIVDKQRYACSNSDCIYFYDEPIEFKAEDHFITSALESHILDLLKLGNTAKQISVRKHTELATPLPPPQPHDCQLVVRYTWR